MRAFAERQFALSAPADKDGKVSCRATLEGLLARTNNPKKIAYYEAELACPPFPPELAYLWRTYHRLRRRVGSNGFAPNPISWMDIDAFCRHARMHLTPWEIETIEMLDDINLSQQAKPQSGVETAGND